MTLLEIYGSFHNGQKAQFVRQVKEYGAEIFACDIATDENSDALPVLTDKERFLMLKTYIIHTHNERL